MMQIHSNYYKFCFMQLSLFKFLFTHTKKATSLFPPKTVMSMKYFSKYNFTIATLIFEGKDHLVVGQ